MKERLTGAIILVAVLVLLVPELLSGPGEGVSVNAEGAESGVQLRSYTIDLGDDASARATAPTSAPTLATDEPVAMATPEPDDAGADESATSLPSAGSEGSADASSDAAGSAVADAAPRSGAQNASEDASKVDGNAARGAPPSVEDDQPRSAFGPNAVQRPKPASDAPSENARGTDSAQSAGARGTDSAQSARASSPAASRNSSPAAERKSSAAAERNSGSSARDAGSGSGRSASSETARPSASDAKVTKGWAVQLGVFASRDNADRLAKQVKGKGYTVSVNETSGNGKRLYRVRVGPEASRTAAVELGAKLRAAGFTGSVVAWP